MEEWTAACRSGDPACFDGEYVYQHSPSEGFADAIEMCAIAEYPQSAQWYPFVQCFEGVALNYCPCMDCNSSVCELRSQTPELYVKEDAAAALLLATLLLRSAPAAGPRSCCARRGCAPADVLPLLYCYHATLLTNSLPPLSGTSAPTRPSPTAPTS